MNLDYVPLLQIQRRLYDLPRGRERFREYLRTMTDGNARDMRTTVECLFGDVAARSLGFTPRGLSPWSGLALALDDARRPDGASERSTPASDT